MQSELLTLEQRRAADALADRIVAAKRPVPLLLDAAIIASGLTVVLLVFSAGAVWI